MNYPNTKISPWSHQVEGWNKARHYDEYYYAVDMGGGKTKMAIDYCNGVNAMLVLVLCPKKVIPVWPRQFAMHSGRDFHMIAPDKKGLTVKKKTALIEKEIQLARLRGMPACVVLNFEAFWRSPLGPTYRTVSRKKQIMVDKGFLLKQVWDVFIADEAHRLKSPGGRASWGAMRLGKESKRRLFLSGTPMPAAPTDVYAQYRALNPSIFGTSYNRFKKAYTVPSPFDEHVIIEYVNQDDLHDKFYSRAFRVTKDEVLDLPGVMHEHLFCDMAPKAKIAYNTLEREFIAQVDNGEITVSNALTKLLRLCQMAGGHVRLDTGVIEEFDTAKLDTMVEKIEDLGPDEPVVIFYRFTPEVKAMRKALTKIGRKVGEISGKANDEQDWIDKKINTVCVQIQAGGEGLDSLQSARYGFFYSKGLLSNGKYHQAIARLDRPGQKHKVTFYHLIVNDTVDDKIEISLKRKGNIIESVLAEMKSQPFGKAA